VQSTSATLANSSDASDFAAQLALDALPRDAAVVDLVYKPRETTVLARAKERGLKTVDGLGMLLHQGALAFELWTHLPAPIAVMRQVLES
jgi:shikimate dehydrogenase